VFGRLVVGKGLRAVELRSSGVVAIEACVMIVLERMWDWRYPRAQISVHQCQSGSTDMDPLRRQLDLFC
jgi:hypothetical protein